MKRDWEAAHEKCQRECCCRVCGYGSTDPAHVIPRSRIKPGPAEDERNIVPLCRSCHVLYDQSKLDLLPYLTQAEQAYAVELVGLFEAYRRITNERWSAAA